MSVVLKGNVDAIVLTGGLLRFKDIEETIQETFSDTTKKAVSRVINRKIQQTSKKGVLSVSNEKYDTMIAQLGALYNEVVAGNMTQEEFFKNAYKYMILDESRIEGIHDSVNPSEAPSLL